MVIGANPTDGHPVFASQMKRRLREGAKLIVVDPRAIDLVRTPHVEARLPPAAAPGHQRRGDQRAGARRRHRRAGRRGVRRRALRGRQLREVEGVRRRAASNSPEAIEAITGVPAAERARRRAAVRHRRQRRHLLRPRRHRAQPGLDHGDGHRQPRDGHRQPRPRRRGREPAARPEQRAGLVRHGLVPARVPRLPPRVGRRRRARCSRQAWGVPLESEPGLRIPNMFEAALDGSFKGLYIQGEDIAQSDPNTQHVTAALAAMECMVVQDLFLNETAKFAHVFLPGSSFLEKDGTFTNAERRISRVRKVMEPLGGLADWEVTVLLSQRARLPDELHASVRDHGRDRAAHADLHRRQLREARRARQHPVAVQRRRRRKARRPCTSTSSCAARASSCSPSTCRPRRGQRASTRCSSPPAASSRSTTSARRRGAPRTSTWHDEDVLEIHPHDAEERGIEDGDWVGIASRAGETVLRARDHRARAAGRRLHHVPLPGVGRQRRSPPRTPTGPPTVPSTR